MNGYLNRLANDTSSTVSRLEELVTGLGAFLGLYQEEIVSNTAFRELVTLSLAEMLEFETRVESALTTVATDIHEIRTDVDTLKTDVSTIKTTVESIKTSVVEMTTDVGTMSTTLTSIEATLDALAGDVTGIAADTTDIATAVDLMSEDTIAISVATASSAATALAFELKWDLFYSAAVGTGIVSPGSGLNVECVSIKSAFGQQLAHELANPMLPEDAYPVRNGEHDLKVAVQGTVPVSASSLDVNVTNASLAVTLPAATETKLNGIVTLAGVVNPVGAGSTSGPALRTAPGRMLVSGWNPYLTNGPALAVRPDVGLNFPVAVNKVGLTDILTSLPVWQVDGNTGSEPSAYDYRANLDGLNVAIVKVGATDVVTALPTWLVQGNTGDEPSAYNIKAALDGVTITEPGIYRQVVLGTLGSDLTYQRLAYYEHPTGQFNLIVNNKPPPWDSSFEDEEPVEGPR